jgi:DNA polymerase
MINAGAGPEDLELLFEDSALGVVASCLRSTIVAGPGKRLVIADFSQIEARVLAWLAGQQDALDIFVSGQDIYIETAHRIGSSSRMLGKICVLALGFAMGHERFRQTALSFGVVLSEDEADAAVRTWRAVNYHIVKFWWDTHYALMRVLDAGPGFAERVRFCTLIHKPGMLLIKLPSGRHLVYRRPRIETNHKGYPEFTYMGSLGGNWTRLRAWPGKTAENITQAVARDVMVEAMLQLRDLPLIATIHDELIAEVPEDAADATLARMLAAMRRALSWAPGLPIDAAGFIVKRYQKG